MKKELLLFLLILIAFSCEQRVDISPKPITTDLSNLVNVDQAIRVAVKQSPPLFLKNAKVGQAGIQKVKEILAVKPDDSENPSMYIINYEGNGFVIISGDNRISPILARSDNGTFPLSNKRLPGGLISWFSAVHTTIQSLRKDNVKQLPLHKKIWEKYTLESVAKQGGKNGRYTYIGDCNLGDSNVTLITDCDPLLSSAWNQDNGYNDVAPYLGCSTPTNGRAYAGCMATAVGQVMRYYQYPSSYNWAAMPLTLSSATTAQLLNDLASNSNLDIGWGCDPQGSGASSDNIPRTFQNFGYPSPSYSGFNGYNYFTVKSDLLSNKPVILGGYRGSYWWIFGAVGGHQWVTDAVYESMYFSCAPDPNTPGEWISVYTGYDASLHMNWGWGGDYNGWYSAFNFNPADRTYNYAPDMVTNIHP